jgi:hypothetical protein
MRFLSTIWIDETTDQGPSEQLMADMGKRFLKVHGTDWDAECEVHQLDEPRLGCTP